LYNIGNISESVLVSYNAPVGWNTVLVEDTNKDGVHQIGETITLSPTVTVPATGNLAFFVVITPLIVSGSAQINLVASSSIASLGEYTGNNNILYGGPSLVTAAQVLTVIAGSSSGPRFADMQFDGIPFVNGDYIGRSPLIKVKLLDSNGIVTSSLMIIVDGISTTQNIAFDGTYLTYQVPERFADGVHTIVIQAQNMLGFVSQKIVNAKVSEKAQLVGKVLPYPNPFNPDNGETMITYQLTADTDLRIVLYSITGEKVWQTQIDRGSEGGHSGFNRVPWAGRSGFGDTVGNGVYLVFVLDGSGNVLAKSKILVIR
jgi:hypothetical protein